MFWIMYSWCDCIKKYGVNVIWMYEIELKNQIKFFFTKNVPKNLTNLQILSILCVVLYFIDIKMKETFQSTPDMDMELEIENSLEEDRNEELSLKSQIGFSWTESTENEPEWESFWWVTLKRSWTYEVPWISKSAKSLKHRQFPGVAFWDCRLTKGLWTVVFSDSLVISNNWKQRKEAHKETFYSQKKLPWWWLDIPWRHVANDGTVRDGDGYIVVAAPLNTYPKGTKIMTTLWPGKVYDTWWMKWKWIDIYVNW